MDEKKIGITGAKSTTVWDAPIRLFHWSITILMGLAWWSAEEHFLDWHRRAGYAILCLLIFRILWGFFGSATSRFSSFCKAPATVIRYVRNDLFARKSSPTPGHNPLGGWSVLAMLAAMLIQTLLGLIAVDVDGLESGPLSHLVSFEMGRMAARAHHFIFDILLVLIVLHLTAIAFHLFHKKQNLTKAMILGTTEPDATLAGPLFSQSFRATILLAWSMLLVFFLTMVIGR